MALVNYCLPRRPTKICFSPQIIISDVAKVGGAKKRAAARVRLRAGTLFVQSFGAKERELEKRNIKAPPSLSAPFSDSFLDRSANKGGKRDEEGSRKKGVKRRTSVCHDAE